MNHDLPRIQDAQAVLPSTLKLAWKGGGTATINVAGWIATGGDLLAPLADPKTFATAHVAEYGTSVAWGDDDDLMIDAQHLKLIAAEQAPLDVTQWQEEMGLSNQEAAELLGVSLSTYNAHKAAAGEKLPKLFAVAMRAAQRDPLIMQAHYRPRKVGRPKKEKAA